MDDTNSATPPASSCADAPLSATGEGEAASATVAASKLDGGIRTAASVASYLRSAIRRRGELFRVQDGSSAPVAVGTDTETAEATNDTHDSDRQQGNTTSESNTQSSSAASSSEDQSPPLSVSSNGHDSLGRTTSSESLRSPSGLAHRDRHAFEPAAAPSPASSHAPRQFEVICDHVVDESDDQDDATDAQETEEPLSRMQNDAGGRSDLKIEYVDVLLQTDAHGLGLNVGTSTKVTSDAIVVQSFRRLHANDVGPAEASGKIRAGDELYSVDGERMTSIHQLYAKVSGVQSGSFLLLRFLRPNESAPMSVGISSSMAGTSAADEKECEEKATPSPILDVEHAIRDNPQVSILIRNLVATNQRLQEQLLASRLKQDELNIQLDQLYSLYARTQLDSGLASSFSLPKTLRPFAWRNGHKSGAHDDTISGHHPLGINRSAYSSKVLLEIEDAVGAEYERLRHNFELQYTLDKQQLERRFAEKAQELEATMAKKVAMLQAGFEQAVRGYDSSDFYDAVASRCCSCDSVNHPETDYNTEEDDNNSQRSSRQQQRAETTYGTEEELSSRQKLDRIVAILDEYRRQRTSRSASETREDLYEEKLDTATAIATTSSSGTKIQTEVSKNQEPETVEGESDPVVNSVIDFDG